MKTRPTSKRSSALLITLVFMVLITIIVVGFLSSMQVNRPAAFSFMERSRAAFYAQDGIAASVATLDQALLPTNSYWITDPGQIMYSNSVTPTMVAFPLSSGTNTSLIPFNVASYPAPDLNVASSRDSTEHMISNTGGPLNLNWIYVLQDGTRSQAINSSGQWMATSFSPTPSNPIVGRFAYWTDDESTKINANTAWGRAGAGNTNSLASPTMVDLTALQDSTNQITQTMANDIHGYLTTNNYATLNNPLFDSPNQVRQVNSGAAAVKHFKSEITSYNHDPSSSLNMFGKPKFVLTTRPDRAGWTYNGSYWVGVNGLTNDPGTPNAGTPYYLRILANEGTVSSPDTISGSTPNVATDPGLNAVSQANLNGTRLNNTLNTLASYIQRTDWPLTTGASSFQTKFYPVSATQYPTASLAAARSAQLAVNIIDYVRSKESAQQIVPPLRISQTVSSTSTNFALTGSALPDGNTFYGSTRTPLINEVGLWLPSGPTGGTFGFVLLYVEIYNPLNYGIVNYTCANLTVNIEDIHGASAQYTGAANPIGGESATMNPGDYRVARISTSTLPNATYTTRPGQLPYRFWLDAAGVNGHISMAPYDDLDSTPYGTNSSAFIELPVNATAGANPLLTIPTIQSVEIDDPRLACHTGAWHNHAFVAGQTNNSLGATNSIYLSTTNTAGAQQDVDGTGALSDASFYMPPPAGTTTPITYYTTGCPVNPLGYVTSVGELGYVHTGIETDTLSYSDPTKKTAASLISMPVGTPWRSIRLQPNNYTDTKTVPDWALLDLFAIPTTSTNTQAAAILAPYGNTVGGRVNINATMQPTNFDSARTMPLQAVFIGATNSYTAGTVNSAATAAAISGNIINRVLSPASSISNGKFYPNAANNFYTTPSQIAEIQGVSDSGESSEENFRETINQLSVRGDVFTIYAVGQAIKITPSGGLVVTGEQRAQSMVERYQDPISGVVSVRTVYYRNLIQ